MGCKNAAHLNYLIRDNHTPRFSVNKSPTQPPRGYLSGAIAHQLPTFSNGGVCLLRVAGSCPT